MSRLLNLQGKVFGRLTVIERADTDKNGHALWLCKCSCGNEKVISSTNLKEGKTKSCGCYSRERTYIHGGHGTRLYRIYQNILARTERRKTDRSFKYYGERGIKMCDEWRNSFKSFQEWSMANGYSDNLEIDRIDNNKGYSPDNCRWVDRYNQIKNRSVSRMITYNGKTQLASEWAKEIGMNYKTFLQRLDTLPINEVFEKPIKPHFLILEYDGRKQTIREWGKELEINPSTIQNRISKGMTIEEALTKPIAKKGENRLITYQGKTQSLKMWAEELGISHKVLQDRLYSKKNQWSVERAFTQKVISKKRTTKK